VPRPQVCRRMWARVCGCHGTTYPNACMAAMAGVSKEKMKKLVLKRRSIRSRHSFVMTVTICSVLLILAAGAWGDSGTLYEYDWYPNVDIPDNGRFEGRVNWPIDLSGAPSSAIVTDVDVEYWINHTYVSDLVVYLTTERNGAWYDKTLWDREGGSGDDIHEKETGLDTWDGI